MDRCRLNNRQQKRKFPLTAFLVFLFIVGCVAPQEYKYTGSIDLSQHRHLEGKKIFVDPGHGAVGHTDGRKGPTGLREEEVNLKVARILAAMCRATGAEIKLSRESDIDVSLDDRVKMATDYKPDLFISIHHNGNSHPPDKVNYPSILIWGNKDENPASYDYAKLLLEEFNKSFEQKGLIASDYSVFRETGARVLFGTRDVCPGILGEFGFFTDKPFETELKDEAFNVKEAESYFIALSEYFKRGIPSAVVLINQNVSNPEARLGVRSRTPKIAVKIASGTDKPGIYPGSLKVTLNDLTLSTTKINDTTYLVNYGSALYGGGYKLRITYRNMRYNSSPVLFAPFAVGFEKDEFDRNIKTGSLNADKGDPKKGLEMLLPALNAGFADPNGDVITYYIARGFDRLNDKASAAYYYSTLYQFYPDSPLAKKIPANYIKVRQVPTDFYGIKTKWEKWK